MAFQNQTEPDDDRDSAIGDESDDSDTCSLDDSATTYTHENGRRYHAYCDGAYLYPNDELEQDRLNLQHAMFTELLGGKLHLAPICSSQHVLDVGTGTGIWAIDFADKHPESTVLGIDLSPIQQLWVPPNCAFEVDNFEYPWLFKHRFDFIHARMLGTSITCLDAFIQQVWESLAPGGRFEIQDLLLPKSDDGTIPEASSYRAWIDDYHEGLKKAGRNPRIAEEYKQSLLSKGFVDVEEVRFKLPQNTWPQDEKLKRLGWYNYLNTYSGLAGWSLRLFTKYLRQPKSDVEKQLRRVKEDIGDTRMHAYQTV
jgi:SAM-dependent methyltransferase